MDVAEARARLLSRADLARRGMSGRRIAAAVRDGTLRRIHRGWYVPAAAWRAEHAEGRHLLSVVAAHDHRRGSDAPNSLASAAVLHKLPLFRLAPRWVHVSCKSADGHVTTGDARTARHEIDIPDADLDVVDGIPCTNLARTVADMIRTAPEETGVALADAALRRVAWDDVSWVYDESRATGFRAQVAERLEMPRGARGVRRGRQVLAFADGRAQLPGESVSRLYLRDLGFRPPRLQVPIPAPSGGFYFVDFGLDDVDAWGEFDGEGKYRDPAQRGRGQSAEDVVLAEKMREDWIRGTTNRRYPRWGMAHIASAATLSARLAAFHVVAP
ncbi:type IV toxin-antitoxin system AbiEi family antitoxin domain-containing protein [Microbacterium sp. 2FI]|uniref:type IV toxin-antitoxin system AbiEi family antitoxin domain-containing protein n=1 Tax=Microbacterium sp. 2FI TaxID=2502193 RepID=UPI0010F641B2|nr:type IV toxin-antitoxin system AbiEi family antitoxin domain-containing protein [Microbacterium sp. 2FI]